MAEPRRKLEDFPAQSKKSVWALIQDMAAFADDLRRELPYDSLTASWHNKDGTDEFTIAIVGRMGKTHHFLNIYTRYFDDLPEPREIYPPNCCAIGTLDVHSSEPLPRQSFEVYGTPERWMVHQNEKWLPLSASYIAFLLGKNQKPPEAS